MELYLTGGAKSIMDGMLLRVNLSNGNISKENIPENYLRDYLGGPAWQQDICMTKFL